MSNKPVNSRKCTMILKYNDKKATEIITSDMESFSWTDNASGSADTLTLTLNNRNLKWFKKGWFPASTDVIKASIKVVHWRNQEDNRKVFCGSFCVDDFGGSGFSNSVNISAISIPIRTGFNVTQRNKTYKKTSVKTILLEIAKRASIVLNFLSGDHKIEEISQGGKTDMEFAFSLCNDYDISLKVYNGKLIAYDQTRYEKRKKKFTLDIKDLGESGAYDLKRSVTKMYDGVKLQYQDKDGKKKTYSYVIPGKKGSRILFISTEADSHADAEKKAKAKLAATLREVTTGTFKVMGDPKDVACDVFELTGFHQFNGRYFIDKVVHEKTDGYSTTISCHRCVTNIS